MTALFERLAARVGAAVPLAVPGLQLVPKGAIALAEHVNRYYRVFTGADPQNVAVRLPPGGGSFEVRHSATNAALLRVTDAGLDFPAGGIGTVELADGSVTSAKILDNEIVDGDINAAANILVTKLAHVGANNVLRSNGTANVGGQVATADIADGAVTSVKIADGAIANVDVNAAAAIAYGKLALANSIVNADIAPAGTAQIAVNKLLHVGAGNVLRSDGAQNVAGQVVTGDIANGTILDADINAAAAINGSKLLDASVSSAKLVGGIAVPANSITTAEIANGTITILDIDPLGASGLAQDNPIINGDFSIWQRGQNLGAGYTADRWDIVNTTTAVPVASRQTNGPPVSSSSPLTPYVFYCGFSTADAAVAAGDLLCLDQLVEGYTWAGLAQRQFTLSFWVRATKPGKHCVTFINGGADRSYVAEYVVNAAGAWEYKTITVAASPLMSDGTWFTSAGIGLYLRFVMMAGSTFLTATPNTWIAGNFTATAGVVNDADNTANVFQLAQVAITPGPYAAPFAARPYGQELALCQRYYQKGTVQTAAPLTAAASTTLQAVATNVLSGSRTRLMIPFPVVMRTTPSVRYWDAVGTLGKVSGISGDTITNNMTPVITPPHTASDYGMLWTVTSEAGHIFGYDLNAELS